MAIMQKASPIQLGENPSVCGSIAKPYGQGRLGPFLDFHLFSYLPGLFPENLHGELYKVGLINSLPSTL